MIIVLLGISVRSTSLARIYSCVDSTHVKDTEEPSVSLGVHITPLPLPLAVMVLDVPGLLHVIAVVMGPVLLDL